MAPALGIAGWSGSGKTTLIERLLPGLAALNLRVAVVKHTRHEHPETDALGSDTRRFWDAGAAVTILIAGDRTVRTQRAMAEPELDGVLAEVRGVDLVLVEGLKRSELPKIEVVRKACTSQPIEGLQNRIAWVTDVEGLTPCLPTFEPDDVDAIVTFIARWAAAGREEGARDDGRLA